MCVGGGEDQEVGPAEAVEGQPRQRRMLAYVMRPCTAAVFPLKEDLHPTGDAPVTRREVFGAVSVVA